MLTPAKKFYPQEQTPIAAVDYRLGFMEDLYLVLGDFARDGSHATVKIQVNRMVSWLWIGGFVLTLGRGAGHVPARRARRRRVRAFLAALGHSAGGGAGAGAAGLRLPHRPARIPSPLVGRPAAAFTLTTFDGAPLSLESLRGKVVVLNFWASWCWPACYEEAPAPRAHLARRTDRGVVVRRRRHPGQGRGGADFPRRVRP